MNHLSDKKFWLGLKLISEFSTRERYLLSHFKTPENIWNVSLKELIDSGIVTEKTAQKIKEKQAKIDLDKELKKLSSYNIKILTMDDIDYPPLLREIASPPSVLFIKGHSLSNFPTCVAIVGARRASLSGQTFAQELARDLSKCGITIVSGLARGIDSAAHTGAVSEVGSTIGVVGCGLNIIYPPENRKLFEKIEEHGALISEYPLGTPPFKSNFPARNRIISGLSLGVIVIEASEKSGALITADFALEQGRDVMAVPGHIKSSLSKGVHNLLKQGAYLVENADDILSILNLFRTKKLEKKESEEGLSHLEKQIIETIGWETVHIDKISQLINLDIAAVLGCLTILELKGYVKQDIGKNYIRLR